MKKNAKLDANTRRQIHEVEQDNNLTALTSAVGDLTARVDVLEQARKVQIGLNQRFMDADQQEDIQVDAPRTFLDRLLGR